MAGAAELEMSMHLERACIQIARCIDLLQTVKARSKSVDTLSALRQKTPGLTQKQQDSALKRLLAQSWQVRHVVLMQAQAQSSLFCKNASSLYAKIVLQMAAANPTTIWDDDDMNDEPEMVWLRLLLCQSQSNTRSWMKGM